MMILLFVSGLSIVRSEEAPDSVKMKGLLKKLTEKKNMKTQKIEAASTCTPPSQPQYLGGTTYTCLDLSSCPGLTCSSTYTSNGVSCCTAYNPPADDGLSTCTPALSYQNTDDDLGSTSYTCYDLSTCPGSTCTYYENPNGVSCCTAYNFPADDDDIDDFLGNFDDDPSTLTACFWMGTRCNSWSSPTGLFSLTYTNNNGNPSVSMVISDSAFSQIITNLDSFDLANTMNTKDLYVCTGTYDSSTDNIIPAYGGCDLSKKSVDRGETYYFITDSGNMGWSISYPLGGAAIAGIVIGVLVFLGCCGVIFVIKNNKKEGAPPKPQTTVVQLGPGHKTTQNPTLITTNAV